MHGKNGNESYQLPDLWCFHLYPYEASVRIDGTQFPIRPGFVGVIPPDTPVEYVYDSGVVRHLYVHFRQPARDVPTDSNRIVSVPAMYDLGGEFGSTYERFERLVRAAGRPSHVASARLWDMLCDLSERGAQRPAEDPIGHPTVRLAVAQIEMHLPSVIIISELAGHCGVSLGYLSRLFRDAFGTSVVGYVRDRRMRRAKHLLRCSSLSIKAVASAVGIPDLHLFNKTVRRTFGCSPRALRASVDE